MKNEVECKPRVHLPWLIEVRPIHWRPSIELRVKVEYAPGIAWDGLCGCWIVPVELLKKVKEIIEQKE